MRYEIITTDKYNPKNTTIVGKADDKTKAIIKARQLQKYFNKKLVVRDTTTNEIITIGNNTYKGNTRVYKITTLKCTRKHLE